MTFDWLVVVNRFVLFVVNRQAMLHIDGMLIYLFVCCLVDIDCCTNSEVYVACW